MFPFWEAVIAPVLRAAEVRTLVEIGALRGEHTHRILDGLGPETVLHVIDPAPGFDPTDHEEQFGARYVFHRRLSVDVLGHLPPMEAALIDGDHNWYTVVNELRLLREVADAHGTLLPVLVLHDVGWPYGRRDLYYDPDTIPAEHRQPHRRAGMRPGRSQLLDDGGMSPGHWNAETEGGPRNGVMTALDDFLAALDRPVRTVVLPMYFGLAIVVEEERLRRQPQLAAELDRIEGAEARGTLIELCEELRLRAVANNHTTTARLQARLDRLADRYLDAVMDGLGGAADPSLAGLRRSLDDVLPDAGPGDVVLAFPADRAAAAAALAGAWLVAHDDARHLWLVHDGRGPSVGEVAVSLVRNHGLAAERLHLVEAATTDDGSWPDQFALLHVDPNARAVVRQAVSRHSVGRDGRSPPPPASPGW